jgi:hypothetical protein
MAERESSFDCGFSQNAEPQTDKRIRRRLRGRNRMTKPISLTCACPDCPNPRRERSKYCSDKCNQKAARIKQRDYDRAYQEAHRRTARSTYPAIRKVVIYDPKCADPYQVPRSEFEEFKSKYLPGTRAIVDGLEVCL